MFKLYSFLYSAQGLWLAHIVYCSAITHICILFTAKWSLHTVHSTLFTEHYSLLPEHCTHTTALSFTNPLN